MGKKRCRIWRANEYTVKSYNWIIWTWRCFGLIGHHQKIPDLLWSEFCGLRTNLRGLDVFTNEDFPEAVQQGKKELLREMKAAQERGDVAYLLSIHLPESPPQGRTAKAQSLADIYYFSALHLNERHLSSNYDKFIHYFSSRQHDFSLFLHMSFTALCRLWWMEECYCWLYLSLIWLCHQGFKWKFVHFSWPDKQRRDLGINLFKN